jgi:hypothetical protein
VRGVPDDGPEPAPPLPGIGRRWKRGLTVFVVLFAILAGSPLVVRLRGRARLLAVRERLAAEGMGRTFADAVAADVACDAGALAAYEAVVTRMFQRRLDRVTNVTGELLDEPMDEAVLARFATGEIEDLPAWIQADRAANEKDLDSLLVALERGPIVASSLGNWIAGGRRGEPDPKRNLWGSSNFAARAALVDSVLSPDPARGLAILEALESSLRHTASGVDSVIYAIVCRQRDRAHLLLQLRGRLPEEAAAEWLAVERPFAEVFADGLRGSRLGIVAAEIEEAYGVRSSTNAASLPRGESGYFEWRSLQTRWGLDHFMRMMQRAAEWTERAAAVERSLRFGTALPTGVDAQRRGDWREIVFALEADVHHRASRVLVRLLREGGGSGVLPAGEPAARARLGAHAVAFDAGLFRLPLRYERLPGTRVLVRAHREGSLPPLPASVTGAGYESVWSEVRDEENGEDRVVFDRGRVGVVLPAGR